MSNPVTLGGTIHTYGQRDIICERSLMFPIVDHVLKVDRMGLSHGYLLEERQEGLLLRLGPHTLAEHHD